MAGADPKPHSLSKSAILMIDAQLEYVSGRAVCDGVEAALEQGGQLLAKARAAGRPVIQGRELHRVELIALSDRFCPIAPSADDIG